MRLGLFVATSIAMLAACESTDQTAVETKAPIEESELALVQSWAAEAGSTAVAPAPQRPPQNLPSVATLLDGLEQRLENHPDDVKGWTLLAASYANVGRMSDARRAKARAVELGADPQDIDRQILAAHTGSGR